MSATPENPPAFPFHEDVRDHYGMRTVVEPGATLRDVFAWQALAGLVASEDNAVLDRKGCETLEEAFIRDAERRAEWSYRQADAMLRERAKGRP